MKRTTYLLNSLIYISFLLSSGLAQNDDNRARIDSLEALLEEHTALTEERVDRLNQLGYEYWIIDPLKSEAYGIEGLELAKVLLYEKGTAFAKRVIGVSHWVRGNLDLSFKYLLEAEALYRNINDSLGLANSYLNLGMAYADQMNFNSASHKYQQALDLFEQLQQTSRMATTYTKMADLLMQRGNH